MSEESLALPLKTGSGWWPLNTTRILAEEAVEICTLLSYRSSSVCTTS